MSAMDNPTPLGIFPFDLNVCPSNEGEDTIDLSPPYEGDANENDSHEGHNHETQPSKRRRLFLDNNKRKLISDLLINSTWNGKLKSGIVKEVASSFSVSTDVVYRIWKQTKETGDVFHKKTKNCGRKRVEIDFDSLRGIPLAKRSSLRSLTHCLGLKSKTQLLKLIKEGVLRRHSSALKPHLKDDNMKARLRFCLSMLEKDSIPHKPKFVPMYNIVHMDEKWFYLTRKLSKYYIHAQENDPYRTCKNKNYIEKVMFLVVAARPRFDDACNVTFSGKIGVFPFVEKVPAKRRSANRLAGTPVTKPISSITKEVIRNFLINKVLPAIKEKWPQEHAHETIYIQQDNAPCHVSPDDEEFCRAASEGGFDIRLTCQPANSPDLNVLDLGFFNAIQSLQQKEVSKSVDELIEAVEKAYETFECEKSNKNFLTLQSCMVEVMKVKGSNNYKIPHMKKDALLAQGKLPIQIDCDWELVDEVSKYLDPM